MRTYHTGVHKVCGDTSALFSITKLLIYFKEKRKRVKEFIAYKSAVDSNTFLFDSARPKYIIVESVRIKLSLCMYKKWPSKYCW